MRKLLCVLLLMPALSLAASGQWVANWLITVSFPTLKDISLALAYGLYALFALLSLLFVAKFIAETKGKQLEDMTAGDPAAPVSRK